MKPREFERVNAPAGTQAKSAEHDIHALLQQNRAVEQKNGINAVVIKKTGSRRQRDFWLLLGVSNSLLALIAWQGRGHPAILVFAGTGLVAVSLGLVWIMWFVMDDY